jgi:lysozyme family protein
MAQFEPAYAATAKVEGGFANNPNDSGGRTWRGISEKNWASWPGWAIINEAMKRPTWPTGPNNYVTWGAITRFLAPNAELQRQVVLFYKINFWDALNLGGITSQAIANEVYDSAVNAGPVTAAKWLQRAINVTNRGGQLAPDVVLDGRISNGGQTVRAVNVHAKPSLVLKALNILQGQHYISLAENRETQEGFIESWFSRVGLAA